MAISALFLLSFSATVPMINGLISIDASSILNDEGFASQPIFYGNANSSNYPESTLRYLRLHFDDRTNTLHVAAWYVREFESATTQKLLHFILKPDKKSEMITVSETGDPSPPFRLFPHKDGGIRLIWNAGTTLQGGIPNNRLYQYIWRPDGSVDYANLPPVPFIPNLSRMVQDSAGFLHVISFQKIPIDEMTNLFIMRHAYETTTEWIEETFPLANVTDTFQYACYDAIVTPYGTLAALLHYGDLNEGVFWIDNLLYVQVSDGNITVLTQPSPPDIRIHKVQFVVFPNNSLAAFANINHRIYAAKFDISGFIIEPIDLPEISPFITEFEVKADSNNRTVIAYIGHEERYKETGTLSVLQQTDPGGWENSVVDPNHLVHTIWENREGWMDGWRGSEGWSNFALAFGASANSLILALASIPTEREFAALETEQKTIFSLYIAQDVNSVMFYDLEPELLDIDKIKKNADVIASDWPTSIAFWVGVLGFSYLVVALNRKKKQSCVWETKQQNAEENEIGGINQK